MTAIVTIIIIGTCVCLSLGLFLLYNNWFLYYIKKDYKANSSFN